MSTTLERMLHACHVACRVLPEGVAIYVGDDGSVSVSQPISDLRDVDMDAIAAELGAEPSGDWSYCGTYAQRTMVAVVDGVRIRIPVRRRLEVVA